DQVDFTFNEGRINLGDLQGLAMIDPSAEPPDAPATLSGEVDEFGEFTADKEDFFFPSKDLNGLDAGILTVDAVAEFAAVGDINGMLEPGTGALDMDDMDISATITVYTTGDRATPLGICQVSPIPMR